MINDNIAARALLRDKILDGLRRAERTLFTRPAPKSARAQMKFLRTREGGSSKSLAERLGVSRKTVDRYLSGATKKPQKRLQAALEQETEAEWQPQVKRRRGSARPARRGSSSPPPPTSAFDAWGKALNGHGSDYMNKVIRIGPVVRALASVTKRQLQEKPLRPLASVQRAHGDDATRACWKEAEKVGDLTGKLNGQVGMAK